MTLIRHGRTTFGERLRIAGTSAGPKVLRMLAMTTEPFAAAPPFPRQKRPPCIRELNLRRCQSSTHGDCIKPS
jgi:hypothetical protein